MLSKKFKLSNKDKVAFVPANFIKNKNFNLLFEKTGSGPFFAVVVSKKTFPTAVLRHRVKRIYYSAVEKILKKENINFTAKIVLYPKATKNCESDLMLEIKNAILKILQRQ